MEDLIEKLREYKKPVVGIGVTAFTRTGPAFLLPDYSIICLQETADLGAIRKKCQVFCLEDEVGFAESGQDIQEKLGIKQQNTSSILGSKIVQDFLLSLGRDLSLVVYKSTPKTEKICHELGIKILSNHGEIANIFEDKKEFRVLGKRAGLDLIPGETLLIDDFTSNKYEVFKQKYGEKLVFQLPDYKVGGGIGTFFINSREDWREFKEFVLRRRKDGKDLLWVNVTRFITGTAGSISVCVTKHGVLCGLVQTQLVDLPEARAFKGRSGVWCGHDWGWKQFSPQIQEKGEKIAKTLGEFMGKKGYKGMLGIDLVIEEKTGEVWPVECNSRYTGAFPVYSMMQDLYSEPSFDVFHLLEFLGIDYQIDLDKVQELYRRPKTAAHVIMHNQERKWVKVEGEVKGGVYKLIKGKIEWQRQGFCLQDIKDKDEFVLCERTHIKGRVLKPGERIARVLFRDKVALGSNKLNEWGSEVCRMVYKAYGLKAVSSKTKKTN